MKDRNEKGFTLIELMIAMTILTIVIALSAKTFRTLVHGSAAEKASIETELGKINGLELIRLDLEHVGFGIARNELNPPIQWTNTATTRSLTLRSTINNTNASTIGWMLLNITANTTPTPTIIADRRVDTTNDDIVLLTKDKQFIANLTQNAGTIAPPNFYDYDTPPQCVTCQDLVTNAIPADNYIATGYPYDHTVTDGCSSASGGQFCNVITYTLSGLPNQLSKCATGSKNLLRRVGAGAGSRVLECVADIQVRFDWDNNNDGDISDGGEQGQLTPPANTNDIINRMKNIDMYILMQAGKQDPNFTFSGDITMNGEITANGGTLFNTGAVPNFTQYRWKVLKISAKPMSW